MKIYAIGKLERQCGGHGDYYDQLKIGAREPYGTGEWHNVYVRREDAESAIRVESYPREWKVIELELIGSF